jgi:hypothetical protein
MRLQGVLRRDAGANNDGTHQPQSLYSAMTTVLYCMAFFRFSILRLESPYCSSFHLHHESRPRSGKLSQAILFSFMLLYCIPGAPQVAEPFSSEAVDGRMSGSGVLNKKSAPCLIQHAGYTAPSGRTAS